MPYCRAGNWLPALYAASNTVGGTAVVFPVHVRPANGCVAEAIEPFIARCTVTLRLLDSDFPGTSS